MATTEQMLLRSALMAGSRPLGGDAPSRALAGAGLGLTGVAALKPWEKGYGGEFMKGVNLYKNLARSYTGLNLGHSLLEVTRPRGDIKAGDFTDPETGEPMTRSAVVMAREAAGQHSPGGEAFRNIIDPGNLLTAATDFALGPTPVGIGLMANKAFTADEEHPSGRIPIVSAVQKARDWASKTISESKIAEGITEGLGTVYDKTIGKVMETAPARALHGGVGAAYRGLDVATGGLLPGGQEAGQGWLAKGYGALDKALGGHLPGGKSPAQLREEQDDWKLWGFETARGFEHRSVGSYTPGDYERYKDYIGDEGMALLARQNVEYEPRSAAMLEEVIAADKLKETRDWYEKQKKAWAGVGEPWTPGVPGGKARVDPITGGTTGPGAETQAQKDFLDLELGVSTGRFDAMTEKAAARMAERLLERGGAMGGGAGAMIGIADRVDEKLAAKTDREWNERVAEMARERAMERARSRF